jgi:hypothetical protein
MVQAAGGVSICGAVGPPLVRTRTRSWHALDMVKPYECLIWNRGRW